jgi:hypothetical protein
MTWLQLLGDSGADLEFREGASDAVLDEVAHRLEHPLPESLRALLAETDGFDDVAGQWEVAWRCGRVAAENERLRSERLIQPTDTAFGDSGAGEPFVIDADGSVGCVSPITGERVELAPTLADFWTGWLTGRIAT